MQQKVNKFLTRRGHHCHGMQSRKHHGLGRHRLQIVLVALPQLRTNLGLRTTHILYRTLDSNDPLQIERIDIVDAGHCDFRVSFLHDPFYRVTPFADYATY